MAERGRTAVDTFRTAAADAATATSVNVKTDENVPGVRLWLEAVQDLDKDGTEELLHRFSPDFILFPKPTASSPRPSNTDGSADYHPMPVEAFLDYAKPYIASPRGWLAIVYVLAVTWLTAYIAAFWVFALVGRPRPVEDPWLFAGVGVLGLVAGILYLQAPRSISHLRERITRKRPTGRLGIRQTAVELGFGLWPRAAWKDYQKQVVASGKYPHKIYARATTAATRSNELYLQYWQFYTFNDWHNQHEADWELVVVRIAEVDREWQPVGAAYSSHHGGHWRPRGEVTWRDGTHPRVYVARGSHAQYFESRPGGYRASITRAFGSLELQIRRPKWTDILAGEPIPTAEPSRYSLAIMPPIRDDVEWTPEEYERWWWLRYDGLWGGSGAVPGPRSQGDKWANPLSWIETKVDRDSASWGSMRPAGESDVNR